MLLLEKNFKYVTRVLNQDAQQLLSRAFMVWALALASGMPTYLIRYVARGSDQLNTTLIFGSGNVTRGVEMNISEPTPMTLWLSPRTHNLL